MLNQLCHIGQGEKPYFKQHLPLLCSMNKRATDRRHLFNFIQQLNAFQTLGTQAEWDKKKSRTFVRGKGPQPSFQPFPGTGLAHTSCGPKVSACQTWGHVTTSHQPEAAAAICKTYYVLCTKPGVSPTFHSPHAWPHVPRV